MAANRRFLLDVISFSQPLDSVTDGPEPELRDADWDNQAFAEYVAEMGTVESDMAEYD
ncbi:hypothetical protein [Modestobacter caceresii]|uniref:hypothetical protein n=1 Tax=Modestobacter caceresii TaxID=1522368 RepID=UPI0012E08C1C|nr:hypothetical protein [Modestobacter caceresii]